jgi:hypothetical protein
MFDLASNRAAWINHIAQTHALSPQAKVDLEARLATQIRALTTTLSEEEAFLVATRRIAQEQGYALALRGSKHLEADPHQSEASSRQSFRVDPAFDLGGVYSDRGYFSQTAVVAVDGAVHPGL